MKASKLYDTAKDNSRTYEIALRKKESHASTLAQQQIQATQEATEALQVIAEMRLSEDIMLGDDIRQVLAKRVEEEKGLRVELGNIERFIGGKQKEVADLTKSLAQADTDLKADLATNEQYRALEAKLNEANTWAKDAMTNHQDIADECKRKLPAYRNDPLYRYLVAAEYGTPEYSRTGIFRVLDDWIAGLCNFSANRQSETMLSLMGDENEKVFTQAQQTVSALTKQLDGYCVEAEKASAIPGLMAQKLAAESDISKAKKRANQIHAQLDAFTSMTDERYLRVRDTMLALVSEESMHEMMKRVQMTKSKGDDEAVMRFHDAKSRIARLQQESAQADLEAKEAKAVYERAKRFERSIREVSDPDRYEYRSDLDFTAIMAAYMLGQASERSALDRVKEYRREIERESYYDTYSRSSWPSYSGSSGSSGGSWGGSSSSGSSSSDDSSFSSPSSFGGSSSDSFSTSDSF